MTRPLIDEILDGASAEASEPDGGDVVAALDDGSPEDDAGDELAGLDRQIADGEQQLEELREQRSLAAGDAPPVPAAGDPYSWLLSAATDREGVVVDPGVAREGPCIEVDVGGAGVALVYHQGVIGLLSDDQQAMFCMEREIHRPDELQRDRIRIFKEASAACSGESTAGARIACLSREITLRTGGEIEL